MRTNFYIFILLILTFSLCFGQSTVDGVRILQQQNGFGARALGMGGAYIGVADDYSAIHYNPAGLAQMRKMEFWTGLSQVNFRNKLDYLGNKSTAEQNGTKFNSIGFVFPVPTYRGSMVFAFGYQKVRDFDFATDFAGNSDQFSEQARDWLTLPVDDDVSGDFFDKSVYKSEFITDDGSINQWSAAGAVDVSPNVSVGLTMNFWSGKSNYEFEYQQIDEFNRFTAMPEDFDNYLENQIITSKYSSFSLKFGAMMHANDYIRLGLALDLPQTFTIKEDDILTSSVEFDNGDIIDLTPIEESREYDLKLPMRLHGGLSVSAGPALLSGGIEYTDWTQFKFDTDYLRDINKEFKTEYRSTLKWHVGGEVGIPLMDTQLRAGYTYAPNPLKDTETENDQKYLTFGIGMLFDRILKLDIAYTRGTWEQFTSDFLTPAGTAEDITLHKALITFAYRF